MRKVHIFLILILLSSLIFSEVKIKFGAYMGYYSPREKVLKEIYGADDVIYGLKAGIHVWNGFYFWISGLQYKRISETTATGEITILTLNPIHFSVRYTYEIRTINPYLELSFTYMNLKEKSRFGIEDDSGFGTYKDTTTGFSLDFGVEFELSSKIILDVGVKYSQAKVEGNDLGGLQGGMSFLVRI